MPPKKDDGNLFADRDGPDANLMDEDEKDPKKRAKKEAERRAIYSADPKKSEKALEKFLTFGNLGKGITRDGLFEKEGGGHKSWKTRYFALYYQYFVYYKPGSVSKPGRTDQPLGWINLTRVSDPHTILPANEKTTFTREFVFQLPTRDRTYFIGTGSQELMMSWIDELQRCVNLLKEFPLTNFEEENKQLEELRATVTRASLKELPNTVPHDKAPEYMQRMRETHELSRKWTPVGKRLKLYAEFQQGANKTYLDWFLSTDGLEFMMQQSEESVLGGWKAAAEMALEKCEEAKTQCFFLEDAKPVLDALETTDKYIALVNQYNKEVLLEPASNFFGDKIALLHAARDEFAALPSGEAITFEGMESGYIRATAYSSTWHFDMDAMTLACTSGEFSEVWSVAPTRLTCQYGVCIWSGETFLWFHPMVPFKLQWRWVEDEFRMAYMPCEGKQRSSHYFAEMDLCDWQFDGDEATWTQIESENASQIIPTTNWAVQGDVPWSILMTVAISPHVVNICRSLLQMM